MSHKRARSSFVDAEAEEDSAEESDSERKDRAEALKRLKSDRLSKTSSMV